MVALSQRFTVCTLFQIDYLFGVKFVDISHKLSTIAIQRRKDCLLILSRITVHMYISVLFTLLNIVDCGYPFGDDKHFTEALCRNVCSGREDAQAVHTVSMRTCM